MTQPGSNSSVFSTSNLVAESAELSKPYELEQPEQADTGQGATPRLINRQTSWLMFNARVLALAEDVSLPFADRMRYCSIWASNLDEYYLVRIAELRQAAEQNTVRQFNDGFTSKEQYEAVNTMVREQYVEASRIVTQLRTEIETAGLSMVAYDELASEERTELDIFYEQRIFPILTPLAFDSGHPFPFISNLSLNLGLLIENPYNGERSFARIKVPVESVGRHVTVGNSVVALEELIAANLDSLVPGVKVLEQTMFRVTRNADMSLTADDLDDHDDDLLSAVEMSLRERRYGDVVRVEIEAGASDEIKSILLEQLGVSEDLVIGVEGSLDLSTYASIDKVAPSTPEFFLERIPARVPAALAGVEKPSDFFEAIAREDILVHHPYDSFDASVLAFIEAAADDPAVQAIKMTMYRMSGDGLLVDALIRAAEAGKQVVVVVEIKARFDEAANIAWARRLEQAGVHVGYGFLALKVHTKTCLVVRQEGEKLVRYCHFGTGNYNAKTARLYTDLGLFTCRPAYGADLSALFNALTGFHVPVDYEELVVAPADMRPKLLELIAQESNYGPEGLIRMKMNSLTDPEMIEALYTASQKGTPIELFIRGICCLRPGLEGLSETIQVRSVLGRYLEHSRIYYFANGQGEGMSHYLIGSADFMTRNLDRRVEAFAPVVDLKARREIDRILDLNLQDNRRGWLLCSDGSWKAPDPNAELEMQVALHQVQHYSA